MPSVGGEGYTYLIRLAASAQPGVCDLQALPAGHHFTFQAVKAAAFPGVGVPRGMAWLAVRWRQGHNRLGPETLTVHCSFPTVLGGDQ